MKVGSAAGYYYEDADDVQLQLACGSAGRSFLLNTYLYLLARGGYGWLLW